MMYEDLWKKQGKEFEIKTEQEMKVKTNWWTYYQYKSLFLQDKKLYGFHRELSELEK